MDWALTGTSIGLIIAFCYLLDWLVSEKEEDKQKVTIIKWWSQLYDFNYGETVRKSNTELSRPRIITEDSHCLGELVG